MSNIPSKSGQAQVELYEGEINFKKEAKPPLLI
jgi:hypothetical protein